MTDRRRLVVVGNGMVGHKLLETVAELQGDPDRRGAPWEIVTFAEEPRAAYDRVGLSSYFTGSTADDLSLVTPGFFERHGITVHLGDRVGSIDTAARTVTSDAGRTIGYDALVLATGSYPFVPPVTGRDVGGTFVYRTIDDLEAMAEAALRPDASVGTVIGGGLLGLEAANALRAMGLETHVVEFAPRLMPVQVDEGGGRALRRRIEDARRARPPRSGHHRDRGRRRRVGLPPDLRRRRPRRPAHRRAGVLGRHPPPRRHRRCGRHRARRAGRHRRRRAAPHLGPRRVGHRRVRAGRRPHLRAGRPRLRHGPVGRPPADGRHRATPSPAPT